MHDSYHRILNTLNVEKHLTTRQLVELLHPNDPPERAYQRIAKSLQYLRTQNLLSSKSYGLIPGKGSAEYFWALKAHPIVKELGLEPPRADIHTFKYGHEKLCADIFVALYQTGSLSGWGQQRISKEIIPDRTFFLGEDRYYLEAEKGNQKEPLIQKKIDAYKKYWRETQESFQVRFVTDDEKTFDMLFRLMVNETNHYQATFLKSLQEAAKIHAKDESESSK